MNTTGIMPPSLIDELTVSLANLQASSYTCGAAMVVMLYDFILTFPDVCSCNPFWDLWRAHTLAGNQLRLAWEHPKNWSRETNVHLGQHRCSPCAQVEG
jgi:hypothetical protein